MGAMKALATELELHWDTSGDLGAGQTWSRTLPDRTLAIIIIGYCGKTRLFINSAQVGEYDSPADALVAVGRTAQAQLSAQMAEWSA